MIDFHRKMLADTVRNEAFAKALRAAVKPGSVVADIGAGTGFLGFIASQAGAKECHLYESGDVWAVGKNIAKRNGIKNCTFVHRHSTEVKKPVPADVVVSETLGNYALEEHILETMNDARERYLKPGGTLIPRGLTQFACPIISDRPVRELDVWGQVGFGLDFTPAREVAFHNAYVRTMLPADLLGGGSAAQVVDALDFTQPNESRRALTGQWKVAEGASVYGCALWWEAELAPGIILSTDPSKAATHWEQIALFLPEPLHAQAGDALMLTLTSDTAVGRGINLTWQMRVFRGGKKAGESMMMDMRKGHLD
ncbi:MAG: 50S ribosomal protein L11 methyltransferase [Candidatus Peribacteraceae bacterium]|jgi:protein arginine N-methyltransferase 1